MSRVKHRTRLSIWSALPPYLGGKRRLCPIIFREIDKVVPRRYWPGCILVDAFMGGGSVALYAKAQGLQVVATDIAERSMVVGQALIANSRVRLTKDDVFRLAAPQEGPPGRIETEFTPSVFTWDQGRFLDRVLAIADQTPDVAKAALYRLVAIRVAMLSHPMSQVRPGTAHRFTEGRYEEITPSCVRHYVDGWQLIRPAKLWELAQQINRGVFAGTARVMKVDVMEELPNIQADVAYFDPPYPGVMSYEKEYRVIDEILEGSSRPTSPFTARNGAELLDKLFERASHVPVWLLSLGNEVVGLSDLETKMTRLGRTTRALEIPYQHLPAVATREKKEANREFLVIGWDPEAVAAITGRKNVA